MYKHLLLISWLCLHTALAHASERFKEQSQYKTLPEPIFDKTKTAEQLKAAIAKHKYIPNNFNHDATTNTCICPAGKELYSNGSHCTIAGRL